MDSKRRPLLLKRLYPYLQGIQEAVAGGTSKLSSTPRLKM